MISITVNVPHWAALYFEYGDCDNLTDQEIAQADKWQERMLSEGWLWSGVEDPEPEFHLWPEFGAPADCVVANLITLPDSYNKSNNCL